METNEKNELQAAVDKVNQAIRDYRDKLKTITKTEEADPIMVEGQTTAGYFCQLMVDPRDAARIMLNYDYPTYRILQDEAPEEMWEELGRHYGLESVCAVDL